MSEECGSCEYNRQCFTKKNVGIFECEKETINNLSEEEIKELIEELEYKEFYRYYEEKIKFIEDLQQKVKQLEKDKSYANWYAVKKEKEVEQLEKENKELNRMCELYGQSLYNADLTKAEKRIEQLENIRKEAITYILAHCEIIRHEKENIDEVGNVNGANLLNILNKGSDKE